MAEHVEINPLCVGEIVESTEPDDERFYVVTGRSNRTDWVECCIVARNASAARRTITRPPDGWNRTDPEEIPRWVVDLAFKIVALTKMRDEILEGATKTPRIFNPAPYTKAPNQLGSDRENGLIELTPNDDTNGD